MKQRDFQAGQSALGLMARNTEAMLAPRMAQWEAFGRGFQSANAIVQNRHAFNEQLAQNRIQNEFKNKEFGFREKEAEESERRFNEQMQENQRQFDQRHALDKQNSLYEQKYKESATAYNYWRMREEEKENQKTLTLKSKGIIDDITQKLQVLKQGKELIEMAPEYLGQGYHIGFNKTLNGLWGANGLWELTEKQNEWVGKLNAYSQAYLHDKFGNNLSKEKIADNDRFLNQKFAGSKQFSKRAAETGKDVIDRLENQLKGLESMNVSKKYLDDVREQVAKYKAFYLKYNPKSAQETQEITPYYSPEELMK